MHWSPHHSKYQNQKHDHFIQFYVETFFFNFASFHSRSAFFVCLFFILVVLLPRVGINPKCKVFKKLRKHRIMLKIHSTEDAIE